MVARRGELLLRIKMNLYRVSTLQLPLLDIGDVIDRTVGQTLCIADREIAKVTAQDALIADLSAAFRMKGRCA